MTTTYPILTVCPGCHAPTVPVYVPGGTTTDPTTRACLACRQVWHQAGDEYIESTTTCPWCREWLADQLEARHVLA